MSDWCLSHKTFRNTHINSRISNVCRVLASTDKAKKKINKQQGKSRDAHIGRGLYSDILSSNASLKYRAREGDNSLPV